MMLIIITVWMLYDYVVIDSVYDDFMVKKGALKA